MAPFIFTLCCALVTGITAADLHPYIIGGQEARVGSWPWQGSLQYQNGAHTCGCVLISNIWILTAAHCVGAGRDSLMVYMGLHDRSNFRVGKPARYYINQIIKHAKYDQEDYFLGHDIALIMVQGQVALNDYVKVIPMAPVDHDFDNQKCFMTGWGKMQAGNNRPLASKLQEAEVFIIPSATCRNYWNPLGDGQICCGEKNKKSSCSGDSGGPLVCKIDGAYHLVGLTSYNLIGCYLSHPSVYTRVSWYRYWVEYHTGISATNLESVSSAIDPL